MWLYMIGGALVLLGVIGTFSGAGIFSIVLVPIGVVILASAFFYAMSQRGTARAAGADANAGPSTGRPLPHSRSGDPAHAPTSPEALADARRAQQ